MTILNNFTKVFSRKLLHYLSYAAEYPLLSEVETGSAVSIPSNILTEIIQQTVFAASTKETRPVLKGVHFSFQKGLFTCAATNSLRLAMKKHRIKPDLSGSCIVPSETLIVKLFSNQSTKIDIFVATTNIVYQSGDITQYSRLLTEIISTLNV